MTLWRCRLVPWAIFVWLIGFTVYVHHVDPDIKWWTRKEWTQFHGQMDSTTILRMPRLDPAMARHAREMMERHYPGGGWLRLEPRSVVIMEIDRLRRRAR